MHALASGFAAFLALVSGFFHPAHLFGNVSLTTLNGTDQLTTFPTTYNNNNTTLNNGKIDVGTTSVASITTLGSLASIGTITTGIWHGTAIGAQWGGTGSTTLSQYQVLLGNGTGNVTTPVGWGTSGQFLTSNGAAALPSWTTSAIDQTGTYNWTGNHTFSTSTIYNLNLGKLYATSTATSTFQNLAIVTNATTTNLTISGTCTGCVNPVQVTNSGSLDTVGRHTTSVTATCSGSKVVTGGGFSGVPASTNNFSSHYLLTQNNPSANNAWTAGVVCEDNNTGGTACDAGTLTVYAICVNP